MRRIVAIGVHRCPASQAAIQWYDYAAASTAEAVFRRRFLRLRLAEGSGAPAVTDEAWVARLETIVADGDAAAALVMAEAVREGRGVAASQSGAVEWFIHAHKLASVAVASSKTAAEAELEGMYSENCAVIACAARSLMMSYRDGIGVVGDASAAASWASQMAFTDRTAC